MAGIQTPVRPSIRVPSRSNGAERADQRLLEVADVLLEILAVALEVEDRIADELPRPVERRLATAVGLDDVDSEIAGEMDLAVLGATPERDTGGCSRSTTVSGIAPCETAPASERCSASASPYGTRPGWRR